MKTVIIYGSTTGSTEAVAQDIAGAFPGAVVKAANEAIAEDLQGVDLLVLGASTWGVGDLQDDMDVFLGKFSNWDVNVKTAAVFGLGDQLTYADSYVDGIADMVDALKNKSIKVVGVWPTDGYGHSASRAQDGDHFSGLALDQDNESNKTPERIVGWAEKVKQEV